MPLFDFNVMLPLFSSSCRLGPASFSQQVFQSKVCSLFAAALLASSTLAPGVLSPFLGAPFLSLQFLAFSGGSRQVWVGFYTKRAQPTQDSLGLVETRVQVEGLSLR